MCPFEAGTRPSLSDEAIRFQYEAGASTGLVSPGGWTLDIFYMHRPDANEIQLNLILSYRTNVALYPAFQEYFGTDRPPLLAVWGRNDPFFIPRGGGGLRTRHSGCGDPLDRSGSFRSWNSLRGNRAADAGFPPTPSAVCELISASACCS
jgi:hypothetical protein